MANLEVGLVAFTSSDGPVASGPDDWLLAKDFGDASGDACCSLLYGNKPEFYLCALHLGFQLRTFNPLISREHLAEGARLGLPERVLLLGPSQYRGPEYREALYRAGWTRVVHVGAISGAHLSGTKRHNEIFTKLRAFLLPYKRVLFLDLDLLLRKSPKVLFEVEAPAGKFHDPDHCWPEYDPDKPKTHKGGPAHGERFDAPRRLPKEAMREGFGGWCVNCGVFRFDPLPRRKERYEQVDEWIRCIHAQRGQTRSMLPEQHFLAEHLTAWHHLAGRWNVETIDFARWAREKALQSACVLHFSGKDGFNEPWAFLDKGISDPGRDTETRKRDLDEYEAEVQTWYDKHSTLLDTRTASGKVVAPLFKEWREVLDELRVEAAFWEGQWGYEKGARARDALEEAVKEVAGEAPQRRQRALQKLEYYQDRDSDKKRQRVAAAHNERR